MLEKKTTEEIENDIEHFNYNNLRDYEYPKDLSRFYNKVWVSQESLIKWLENNTLKPRAECQDCRRQMEARIKREAFKIVLEELKGEKE